MVGTTCLRRRTIQCSHASPTRNSYAPRTLDRRALVTENVKDFDRIVRSWSATGEHHAGVVFTSPRRYHRASQAYPANLVAALTTLLAAPPSDQIDMVVWLP